MNPARYGHRSLFIALLLFSAASLTGCGKSVESDQSETLPVEIANHPVSCLVYDLKAHFSQFGCPVEKVSNAPFTLTKAEINACLIMFALPNFDTLDPIDKIYIPKFDVADFPTGQGFPYFWNTRLSSIFEYYGLSCATRIIAPHEGWYWFKLRSADGANFYVNGWKVIDNDGIHVPQDAHGDYYLYEGENEIRVDFYRTTNSPYIGHDLTALKLYWKIFSTQPSWEIINENGDEFSSTNRHDWYTAP